MARNRAVKRLIDVCVAVVLLVVTSPALVISALLIRATMGAPVLFRQQRPGYLGQPFMLLKFRTMREAMGRDGVPLPDEDRLTGVGRLLRRTSLDELPQLLNVVRGDMSLVGPRPLLMEYLGLYSATEARRHEVRPGITGWAQVSGRNATSWPERFALDVWYVDHRSLGLDMRILLRTLLTVLRGKGISQAGHATMAKFEGHRR
jgi:lipopolysaccharide/colanic/teichoic acid biosynthesis glycosyltransferase